MTQPRDREEEKARPDDQAAHAKEVRSDLKDLTPGKQGAAFPHDVAQTAKSRKDRHPVGPGDRSDHVPHAIPRGDNEQRGGRDRVERRR
jgi:hypothetical protein